MYPCVYNRSAICMVVCGPRPNFGQMVIIINKKRNVQCGLSQLPNPELAAFINSKVLSACGLWRTLSEVDTDSTLQVMEVSEKRMRMRKYSKKTTNLPLTAPLCCP